ncbi:MAG TPA: FAD-dependent monooxygenase [Sorangium sp.]|nr:FAD-dependent monooxygenase [Sorangium sp.]
MQNRNILISGASIAGPALAYWLRRHGFNPTLVERAPALRDGGYAVDVRGPALEVLARMGLGEAARRASTDTLGTSFVDERGGRVADLERGFGVLDPADIEIMRGDLAHLLHDATRRDAEYIFGDSITAIAQRGDGVEVTFERSAPRVFDLVVGADGLHSNVRRLVFGEESRFVRHLGSHLAIFTAPNHLGLDRWQLMLNLPGRVVSLKSARGNAELKVSLFFASAPLRYDHRDAAQQRRLVAEAFAGAGWEMPRVLEAMRDAPDFYFDATSQIRMDRWWSGRVALVGDAAYSASPLTGQGTSLALVGAYVLAGELAAAGGDHRAAFARYQDEMRGYVDRSQESALAIAKGFAPETRWEVWSRNTNLRMLRYLPWKDFVFSLMTRDIRRAASAITLKSYRAASGRAAAPSSLVLPAG